MEFGVGSCEGFDGEAMVGDYPGETVTKTRRKRHTAWNELQRILDMLYPSSDGKKYWLFASEESPSESIESKR